MINTLQGSVHSAIQDFQELCHVNCIKDHTVKDAFQVMLISLCALARGEWENLKARPVISPPSVGIKKTKMYAEHAKLLEAFESIVTAASNVPAAVKKL